MIDPVDLRTFPPAEALSSVPDHFRQTLLSKFTECPRSAYLYLKYNGGPLSHPLAGGTLLHRAVEKLLHHMVDNEESTVGPEVAKDILNETLVESKDLTVSAERFDKIRAMMFHIAEGLAINPNAVVCIEGPVTLDVNGTPVTGTIDFAELLSPTKMLVLDWKSAFLHVDRKPDDEDEWIPSTDEWEGSFQMVLYALAMATGSLAGSPFSFEGITEFELREVHPRTFWEREGTFAYRKATIPKEALLDWQLYLAAVVDSLNDALTDWQMPAIQGHHCDFCPASAECPIPAPLRDYRGEIRTEADAVRAAIRWERHSQIRKQLWEAMKGYAGRSGRIRYGKDLELRNKTSKSEKIKDRVKPPGSSKSIKGRDALKSAVYKATEFGVPFDWDDYFTPSVSTRFTRRTLKPEELTAEKERKEPTE